MTHATAAAAAVSGAGLASGPPPTGLAVGPTPSTVTELCIAIGLEDDARDAMLTALGATLTTPLAGLSAVTRNEVDDLITSLAVGSSPPSLLEKSAIRLFFTRTSQ